MPVGDAQPPADDPLIGLVLSDRYRIVRKVGEGGMGAVYQAEHALIEKRLALKILFPELTRRNDLVARFLQEAKSASRIGHENVIDISDFGQSPEGLVYIAMEFLEGSDLGFVLKNEGPQPWNRARPILMQIAKALRAAHEHGIIHRDMKPENVFLIQREGRPDFVKVLDFGIAKVVNQDDGGPRLTQAGAIFGTPEYMAPEQAQGQAPDHRVDVYAVGCIMYHLLTGEVPFHAENFMGILTKHMLEPVIPPRVRQPKLGIAADVEAVCMRALEKDREKRWQDMDAFYRALGAAGGEPFEASGVYVANPALRFPTLATPNPVARAREMKTEVAPLPVPAATFDDERPVARRSAGLKLGGVVVAVAVVAVLAVLVLRPSKPPPKAEAKPAPAVVTPPPAPVPAEAPKPVEPAPAVEAKTEPTRPHVPARKPRRSSGDAVRDITSKAGLGGEGAAPDRAMPTPAELKNPFGN
ncbi:MAG TPA: serine/threonine-protein kinase [Polyangia bacterium]|nr:serine/threonine-protein kinase [Polyangia bacterium]